MIDRLRLIDGFKRDCSFGIMRFSAMIFALFLSLFSVNMFAQSSPSLSQTIKTSDRFLKIKPQSYNNIQTIKISFPKREINSDILGDKASPAMEVELIRDTYIGYKIKQNGNNTGESIKNSDIATDGSFVYNFPGVIKFHGGEKILISYLNGNDKVEGTEEVTVTNTAPKLILPTEYISVRKGVNLTDDDIIRLLGDVVSSDLEDDALKPSNGGGDDKITFPVKIVDRSDVNLMQYGEYTVKVSVMDSDGVVTEGSFKLKVQDLVANIDIFETFGNEGGVTPSVLDNDRYKSEVVNDKVDIESKIISSPIVMQADGKISVPAGIPAGIYEGFYTIVSKVDNTLKASAKIVIKVRELVADDDEIVAFPGGTTSNSLLDNDKIKEFDGSVITTNMKNEAEVRGFTINEASVQGKIKVNKDGTVWVEFGVPDGTYNGTYNVCDKRILNSCVTKKFELSVFNKNISINSDNFGPVQSDADFITGNIFENDYIDNQKLQPSDFTGNKYVLEYGPTSFKDERGNTASFTFDKTTGTIFVPKGTRAGVYKSKYKVLKEAGTGGVEVPVTIQIVSLKGVRDVFKAEKPEGVITDTKIGNVLFNDELDGRNRIDFTKVEIKNVSFNKEGNSVGGIKIDYKGDLYVDPTVGSGTYVGSYDVCYANSQICSHAEVEFVILEPNSYIVETKGYAEEAQKHTFTEFSGVNVDKSTIYINNGGVGTDKIDTADGSYVLDKTKGEVVFTPKKGFFGTANVVKIFMKDVDGVKINVNYIATVKGKVKTENKKGIKHTMPVPDSVDFKSGDISRIVFLDRTGSEVLDASGKSYIDVSGKGKYSTEVINSVLSVTFMPDANFVGDVDEVSVKITNKNGKDMLVDYKAVVVDDVTPPTPNPNGGSNISMNSIFHEDEQGKTQNIKVTYNDVDLSTLVFIEGGTEVKNVNRPGIGVYKIDNNGTRIIFTPDVNYVGVDVIQIKAKDLSGKEIKPTTLTVSVVRVKNAIGKGVDFYNVITPNGDGINDYLIITGLNTSDNSISIYNRWGVEVFKQDNYDNSYEKSFKGYSNGRITIQKDSNKLPAGIYFLVINYVDESGEGKTKSGWIYVGI